MRLLVLGAVVGALLRQEADPPPDLTVEEAKKALPAEVQSAFTAAVSSKAEAAVLSSLAELSELYASARTDYDQAVVTCKNHKEHFARELKGARTAWQEVQQQATTTMARMGTAQTALGRASTEIEAYRRHHAQLTSTCSQKQSDAQGMLAKLEADLPIAKQIVTEATAGCPGAAASLLSCKVQGHHYTTFADDALRDLVTSLSVPSEQFASLALMRSHETAAAAAALVQKHSRVKRARALRAVRAGEDAECEAVDSPGCEAFVDIMNTFQGNVVDAADELREKMAAAEQHCQRALDDYDQEVKASKLRADALNTELATAAAAKADLGEEEDGKKRYFEAAQHEAETVVSGCEKQKAETGHTLAAVKKLKAVLKATGVTLPPFEGDCEVSEWVREPCSAQCEGGTQTLRREIISMPDDGLCPPLNRTESCNAQPCPTDCKMGAFGDWTLCSRNCGGGTRQRARTILSHPAHGGQPCGNVLEQEVCNPHACSQDCHLSPWSTWSGCSRSCGGGHEERARRVLRGATGGGTCPLGMSADRYEAKECNVVPCADTVNCKSKIDLVILVDGSGSAGAAGLAAQQAFVQSLASRLGEDAQVAVVLFGSTATVVAPLGAASALGAVTLTGDAKNTDLARGLAVARDVLVTSRGDASNQILVITDGMPLSKHLAGVEIARARETADVSFVIVGDGVNKHTVKEWVSVPAAEHLVRIPSFDELATSTVPILGTACPLLE